MFSGAVEISAQDLKTVSTVALMALGSLGRTKDGRLFRYSLAGAAALVAGKLSIAAAKVANHTNIGIPADVAVGVSNLTVTLGATAATLNQYAEGILSIVDGTGKGLEYIVRGHAAAASAGALLLYLDEPLAVALATADTKVSLVQNRWANVVESATAGEPAGVTAFPIPIANYGWLQTGGRATVLSDGIIAKAVAFKQSASIAGAIAATAAATDHAVGSVPEATVDTKYYPALLEID